MSKDVPQSGVELIVYQISEVKNGITTLTTKLDGFQERLTNLEQWRAVVEAQKKDHQGMFFNWMGENAMTKIALAALTLALAVVAGVSNGVIK